MHCTTAVREARSPHVCSETGVSLSGSLNYPQWRRAITPKQLMFSLRKGNGFLRQQQQTSVSTYADVQNVTVKSLSLLILKMCYTASPLNVSCHTPTSVCISLTQNHTYVPYPGSTITKGTVTCVPTRRNVSSFPPPQTTLQPTARAAEKPGPFCFCQLEFRSSAGC